MGVGVRSWKAQEDNTYEFHEDEIPNDDWISNEFLPKIQKGITDQQTIQILNAISSVFQRPAGNS